jgi:predicted exporter
VKRLSPWWVWLGLLGLALFQVVRTPVASDITSFLPGAATPEQRVMIRELSDGLGTRLVIVGLSLPESASNEARDALARSSRELRRLLAQDSRFIWVSNGELGELEAERARLFDARYHLSDQIRPERFTIDGLREALRHLRDELSGDFGAVIREVAAQDPTLESVHWLKGRSTALLMGEQGQGWRTADGRTALLVLETRARARQTNDLREAMDAIGQGLLKVTADWPSDAARPILKLAGPAYFGLRSHDAITADGERLTLIALLLIAALDFSQPRRCQLPRARWPATRSLADYSVTSTSSRLPLG